jgi:uncharacterized protein (AIM24 family)
MEDGKLNKSIKIIGTESQCLHIILERSEKVNINKNYIVYASSENLDEIVYKNVDSFLNMINDSSFKRIEDNSIVRLKNKGSNIEYVGLSRGGKIMKIVPFLYNNLYIKTQSILAFEEGINVVKDKDIDQNLYKLIDRANFQYGVREIIDSYFFDSNGFCLVKNVPCLNIDNLKGEHKSKIVRTYLNDYIYISGKKNLFEKRLGENESIVIMANGLIAFEQSVTFRPVVKDLKNIKYVNNLNDIIAQGPGLVIFELAERKMPFNNQIGNKLIIGFAILLFVLEVVVQFLIHMNLMQ